MQFLITLEQTESGFSVQVPDLAILTYGGTINTAKQAAVEAIQVNLNAYKETGKSVPYKKPIVTHLENPDYKGLLFTFVDIAEAVERAAA